MLSKKFKSKNGITLVALVVTIIILLILTGITISSLTKTGIFQKANDAKQKSEKAEENQTKTLNEYENELDKYISGNNSKVKLVSDNIGKVLSTTDNTELQDAYGNKIVVPAGFKIVSDSTTSNAQTVDKGIVVEDETVDSEGKATATAGSQFVWIPVGKIYTDVEKSEVNVKTITLGRYDFDETTGNEKIYTGGLIEEDKGDTNTTLKNYGNTIAKNITNFKNSVATNGGYYIGRYEARTTTARTAKGDTLTQITEKGIDQIYNYVTQVQSAQLSQNMYNISEFTSDLMNSYAWDTAIIFIQKCSGQKKYAYQISLNDSLSTTGTTNDKQCNIFDMASNIYEWTTETGGNNVNPCTYRGGYYNYKYFFSQFGEYVYTSSRKSCPDVSSSTCGFRPILYLNV